MKHISAVTIGKLIEAHMQHDEEKFLSYANFVAEAYEESGDERSARIIRSKISGEYKKQPEITLDNQEYIKSLFSLFIILSVLKPSGAFRGFYTVHDGKEYNGQIHIDGSGRMNNGHGHEVKYR